MPKPKTLRSQYWSLILLSGSCCGQNLAGTVLSAEKSDPVAGGTIIAYVQSSLPSDVPGVYKAKADGGGRFSMKIPAGKYLLCTNSTGDYLDPCKWGVPLLTTVTDSATTVVSLRLAKGATLIVRTHDTGQNLKSVDALSNSNAAVAVTVTTPSGESILLPVVYDNGRVRDHGLLVPTNTPLKVRVNADRLVLKGVDGANLNSAVRTVQILPAELELPAGQVAGLSWMHCKPTAKVLHVFATGVQ